MVLENESKGHEKIPRGGRMAMGKFAREVCLTG